MARTNPFLSAAAGPTSNSSRTTGRTSTAARSNPFLSRKAVAQQEAGLDAQRTRLANLEEDAAETGDKGILDQVTGIASKVGGAVLNPIHKTLELLDLPRAAVVSGVNELIDAFDPNDPASLGEFFEQTGRHMGAGEILEEYGSDLPINLKRALGFVGDVGLDPLTYVTFGAAPAAKAVTGTSSAIARQGGRKVARTLLTKKQIARQLGELGEDAVARLGGKEAVDATVEKVLRTGTGALPREVAQELGVRTGASFGLGSRRVMIPGTEGAAAAVAKATGAARRGAGAVVGRTPLRSIPDAFEVVPGLRKIRQSGPDGYRKAFQAEEALRDAKRLGIETSTRLHRELETIVERFEDIDKDTLRKAVEGDDAARAAVPEAAAELAGWLERARVAAEAATGRSLPKFENYLPHQLSAEFRRSLDEGIGPSSRKARRKGQTSPERFRAYAQGRKKFMGEHLETGSIDELHDIARSKLGDDYVELFKTDPWAIARSYADQLEGMVGREAFDANLKKLGLVVDFDRKAFTSTRKANKKIARQIGKLEAQRAQIEAVDVPAQLVVGDTAQAADQAAAQAIAAASARGRASAKTQTLAERVAQLRGELGEIPVADESALRAARERLERATAELDVSTSRSELSTPPTSTREALGAELQSVEAEIATSKGEIATTLERITQLRDEVTAIRTDPASTIPDTPQGYFSSRSRSAGSGTLTPEAAARLGQINDELIEAVAHASAVEGIVKHELAARRTDVLRRAQELASADADIPKDVARKLAPTAADAKRVERAQSEIAEASQVLTEEQARFDSAVAAREGALATQAQNTAKLAEVEGQLSTATGAAKHWAEQEQAFRLKAERLFAAADAEADEAMGAVARLEALAAEADASALTVDRKIESLRGRVRPTDELEKLSADVIDRGLREFTKGRWAEPEVAAAVLRITEVAKPKQIGSLMKLHDQFMSRWKAYSLLSPGFHARNYMGGLFNNALAGVDFGSYRAWNKALGQIRRGKGDLKAVTNVRIREAMEAMFDNRIFGESNIRDMADAMNIANSRRGLFTKTAKGGRFDPTSLDFVPLTANRRAGAWVEKQLRGPLFLDRYLKTGRIDEALESVKKYHFDYDELSDFERNVARRIFPFYTWTRKNLPLQLEMMARKPGLYTRYLHAKRNIELGTDAENDEFVPEYFSKLMAIRTPFSRKGSGPDGTDAPIYLTPDLPFRDVAEVFNRGTLLGSMSPVIKVPLELAAGKEFYSDIPFTEGLAEAPSSWKPLLPVLDALGGKFGLPNVVKQGGSYYISDADAYKIEQTLPLLGRMRRLAPSEDRYQERALTSYLSTIAGISSRTLGQSEQRGEAFRRIEEIEGLLKRYRALHPEEELTSTAPAGARSNPFIRSR